MTEETNEEKSSALDKVRESVMEHETFVKGVVTRVVPMGSDEPLVFFQPTSEVRHLELEGHRIATGELLLTHDKPGVPKQFDLKRVALSGDLAVGAEIGLVHLDKVRR